MADVHLPRSLVDLFPGAPRFTSVDAPDVTALIKELDRRHPGLWDRLCAAGPAVREHINIFVDGEKGTLTMPLTSQSVVRIIPAVSGG